MSTITILTASPKVPQTKTITAIEGPVSDRHDAPDIKLGVKQAKMSTFFSSKEIKVDSINSLAKILEGLRKDPFSFVIRGCVLDNVDKKRHYRRKAKSNEGTIQDVDQQWLCIDLDKKPLHALGLEANDLVKKPGKVIKALMDDLPICLKNASCWWHFSSSTGITKHDVVSVHLWFWLDQPMSNNDLRQYFGAYNEHMTNLFGVEGWVDLVTFDSIQPHFTADPQLIDLEDPIPERSGLIKGKTSAVKISEDWITVTPLDKTERWKEYLEKIGDSKDGFHQPLLSASASWVRKNGYSESANKEFINIAREFIDNADRGERSDDEINRYRSDQFLGQLLRTASEKGFDLGGPIVTEAAANYFRDYVYVSPQNKFFKKPVGLYVSKDAFNLVGRKYGLGSAGANIFVESNGTVVDKVACLPGEEIGGILVENGEDTYNSWPGRKIAPSDKPNGKMLEDHIHYICGGEDRSANLILDYMCHVIQHPGLKVMWAPVLGSKTTGIGKSIIKELYYSILAPKMITEIGVTELGSDFNEYMFNHEMLFIEEVYTNNRKNITDKLKTMITEKRITVNIKNVSAFNVPNTINMFLFTNHANALYIDEHDRRFFPTYVSVKPKEGDYYKRLVKYFREETANIMAWMMNRDLSKFDRSESPPMTDAKKAAVQYSTPEWRTTLIDALEGEEWPFQHDIMVGSDLIESIYSLIGRRIAPQYISDFLTENNVIKWGDGTRVRLANGSRSFVYVCRNHEKYMGLDGSDIAEKLNPVGDKNEWRQSQNY